MNRPKAVVMLSGGLDSATVAAQAIKDGFEVVAISFDYGQRHRTELKAAQKVAAALDIKHHTQIGIDLGAVGGSALTDAGTEVPKDSLDEEKIPITYVPARNTIFLSVALGVAEAHGAFEIYFGANALDYSGYPDCRPEFVEAFENLANLATADAVEGRGRYRIRAPLMALTKAEIIRLGTTLGVDYGLTHSCYDPQAGLACGHCDSCLLRKRGFAEAALPDPTRYVEEN